jgi:hypothetical protein
MSLMYGLAAIGATAGWGLGRSCPVRSPGAGATVPVAPALRTTAAFHPGRRQPAAREPSVTCWPTSPPDAPERRALSTAGIAARRLALLA